ncbi:flavin-containing monooxygenase [Cellulomonas soli]|uniref:Monooxygenase n=1 Tax=Cellulomonas soli TaxID=931535 RepID=A0A512P9Y6_9CELL|nr:NAD(P)/FAD-dependent oxidoreductase [Cellulomonas soli]NYI60438.1 cation diffusion facilitator CzcD-associated flavoprotein CzcO [Cellulomonas soli]GEP67952.1 monooxygenase [Cellulomonas soli]
MGTELTDVVVIGAGIAGIGLAVRLRRAGVTDFVVLERADDIGGTWRDNTYPGVACDIPSHLYALSFLPHPGWTRVYAPGAEIHEYLRAAARSEGVLGHVRLRSPAQQMTWDAPARRWHVDTPTGRISARVLVVAAGRLTEPHMPDVPGLEDFEGSIVHSARWDPDVPIDGARVGVVGTGASAIQIVPAIAHRVDRLVVFQRSAPYVVPRDDQPYTAHERARFAQVDGAIDELRARTAAELEQGHAARRRVPEAQHELRARALTHLRAQVQDLRLRRALTPDHEVGCKRVLLSDDYYPALGLAHVDLRPSPLARVRARSAVAQDGTEHTLDVLVLATGFRTSEPTYAPRVRGRGGRVLADHWSGGMTAYASSAVHGFPNMFLVDGPNAALGHSSGVALIEAQIDYVLGAIAHLTGPGAPVLEVTARAEETYTRRIDAMAAGTVWLTGCRSWYVDERSGRLTLLWPGDTDSFRAANGTFSPAPYQAA